MVRYVAILSATCGVPEQWCCFYPFWNDPIAGAARCVDGEGLLPAALTAATKTRRSLASSDVGQISGDRPAARKARRQCWEEEPVVGAVSCSSDPLKFSGEEDELDVDRLAANGGRTEKTVGRRFQGFEPDEGRVSLAICTVLTA
jgi:hypothetical protein